MEQLETSTLSEEYPCMHKAGESNSDNYKINVQLNPTCELNV